MSALWRAVSYAAFAEATGVQALALDTSVDPAWAAATLQPRVCVQGNLDPSLLLAPWPVLAERVREVIRAGAKAPGHIFNLGHGVPPTTDPDVLTRIVELIHAEGPALRAAAREGALA